MPRSTEKSAEDRMESALSALRKDLSSLRAGRANPAILERVQAEYYGAMTPINQLANISSPDPRTLLIQAWDKTSISAIEKAIQKSDLGLTPTNDGDSIRIVIPMLTEERRSDLVKVTKKFGEEAKITIRNVRRDANEEIKKMEKDTLSEDESHRHQENIQKTTDRFVAEVDKVIVAKEKEIMEV